MSPISDIIDDTTFEYKFNHTGAMNSVGGFNWELTVEPRTGFFQNNSVLFLLIFLVSFKSSRGTQFRSGNGNGMRIRRSLLQLPLSLVDNFL